MLVIFKESNRKPRINNFLFKTFKQTVVLTAVFLEYNINKCFTITSILIIKLNTRQFIDCSSQFKNRRNRITTHGMLAPHKSISLMSCYLNAAALNIVFIFKSFLMLAYKFKYFYMYIHVYENKHRFILIYKLNFD